MTELKREFLVSPANSAAEMGSGDLAVLATPALIAFVEETCKDLIGPKLSEEETTVGSFIQLEHRRPTKLGAKISVVANLTERTKNTLTYHFSAYEGELLIAQGEHQRGIVNRQKFMARLDK